MNAATIDAHVIVLIDLGGKIFNPSSIDNHSSRGDDLIAGTP
jgi:hypothetical protein